MRRAAFGASTVAAPSPEPPAAAPSPPAPAPVPAAEGVANCAIVGEDIQPLNKSAIPNLANISPDFQDLVYDPPGDDTAPYQWGTTGLAVDTAVVGTDFPRSWGLIFDPAIATIGVPPAGILIASGRDPHHLRRRRW